MQSFTCRLEFELSHADVISLSLILFRFCASTCLRIYSCMQLCIFVERGRERDRYGCRCSIRDGNIDKYGFRYGVDVDEI